MIGFNCETDGLIICILFLRERSASQCVHIFDSLARRLFQRSQADMNLIKRFYLIIKSWYKDGYYNAAALENCLKQYLEINDQMFDYQSEILATKVGVIAAIINNASPVIFTNYNGPDIGKNECGKDPAACFVKQN